MKKKEHAQQAYAEICHVIVSIGHGYSGPVKLSPENIIAYLDKEKDSRLNNRILVQLRGHGYGFKEIVLDGDFGQTGQKWLKKVCKQAGIDPSKPLRAEITLAVRALKKIGNKSIPPASEDDSLDHPDSSHLTGVFDQPKPGSE